MAGAAAECLRSMMHTADSHKVRPIVPLQVQHCFANNPASNQPTNPTGQDQVSQQPAAGLGLRIAQ